MNGQLRQGKGILIKFGEYRYEGDFVVGEITGIGNKFFANGDVYEGEIKNNVLTGKGRMIYADD